MKNDLKVTYCWRWNFQHDEPGTRLSEAEARANDTAGEEYTAVLTPTSSVYKRVLVTPVWKTGYVFVDFLDAFGRKNTEYVFSRYKNNKMFLCKVVIWDYPSNEPRLHLSDASKIERIIYDTDGIVKRVVVSKKDNSKETVEYSDVPVAANWESVPVFGSYDSIGRYERNLGL